MAIRLDEFMGSTEVEQKPKGGVRLSDFMVEVPKTENIKPTMRLQDHERVQEVPVDDDEKKGFLAMVGEGIDLGVAKLPELAGKTLFMYGHTRMSDEERKFTSGGLSAPKDTFARRIRAAGLRLYYQTQNRVKRDFQNTDKPSLGRDLGMGVSSLAASLGLGFTMGPIAPGVIFGATAMSEGFFEAIQAEKPADEAIKIAGALGLAEGTLEFVGVDKFIKMKGGIIKRAIKGAMTEFLQESSQSVAGETIRAGTGLREFKGFETVRDVAEQALYEGAIGAVLGGGAGIATASIQRHDVENRLKKAGMSDKKAKEGADRLMKHGMDSTITEVEKISRNAQRKETIQAELQAENKGRELTPEEQTAQDFVINQTDKAFENYEQAVREEFKTNSQNIVSADAAKFAIPGMNAEQSGNYHEAGSALAKQKYKELLENPDTLDLPVMFTAGGSGSGKSYSLRVSGNLGDYAAIYDTNLNNYNSAKKKIDQARNTGREVVIKYVYRDPLKAWTGGVIPRVKTQDRIVPIVNHIETHLGSLETLHKIAKEYPDIEITVFDNNGTKKDIKKIDLADAVSYGYTKESLEDVLIDETQKAFERGDINEQQYQTAIKGTKAEEGSANISKDESGNPAELQQGGGVRPQAITESSINQQIRPLVTNKTLTKDSLEKILDQNLDKEISRIETQEQKRLSVLDTAKIELNNIESAIKAISKIEEYSEMGEHIFPEKQELLKSLREDRAYYQDKIKGLSPQKVTKLVTTVLKEKIQNIKRGFRKGQSLSKLQIKDTQEKIINLLNESDLDANDKAKFIATIKNTQTDEQIKKAIPDIEERIADLEQKAERRDLIRQINRKVRTADKSKQIAVDFVNSIKEAVSAIDLKQRRPETIDRLEATKAFIEAQAKKGENVEIPRRILKQLEILDKTKSEDVSNEDLRALSNQIDKLLQLGETKLRARQGIEEARKAKDLSELQAKSKPMVQKQIKRPEIGQRLGIIRSQINKINNAINNAQRASISITPMDVVFDMLDGNVRYKGPNHRIFKKAVDKAFGEYMTRKNEITDSIVELAKKYKFDERNFERIGLYAAAQQEGGAEKLINMGFNEESVLNYKIEGNELAFYNEMRKVLDDLRPEIAETMRIVYNENLGSVKNYFPFMTDFEAMNDSEIRARFGDNVEQFGQRPKKNVQKGFTITRKGGSQKLKLNALEIFLKHTDNVAYLLTVGNETKRLGELAATEEYAAAVGEFGQELVRDWIDLVARKGSSQGDRIPLMDLARRHTGIATLAFKLSSFLVQPTAIFDGAAVVGPEVFRGAADIALSKKWRKFLLDNFAEIKERAADDPAYLEFGGEGIVDTAARVGFYPLQKLDILTASAVAAGAYRKAVADLGQELDLDNPNQDAIAEAQLLMRRSQSSAFFKDVPSALSRGRLTGNKSFDKLILQFQSFMLNRWSVIRHDALRAGVTEGNPYKAMNIFFFLLLANFAELGLRRMSKEFISGMTGDDLDDWEETFTQEVVFNLTGNVPFVSSIIGAGQYSSIPIPSVDMTRRIIERFNYWQKSKNTSTREKNSILFWTMFIGYMFGVPGTVQTEQILRKTLSEGKKGRR